MNTIIHLDKMPTPHIQFIINKIVVSIVENVLLIVKLAVPVGACFRLTHRVSGIGFSSTTDLTRLKCVLKVEYP